MRRKEKSGILIILFLLIFMVGCAATLSQKRVTLGLADWFLKNDALLRAEYNAAPFDRQMWLWENVVPPMMAMRYGIIGLNGVQEENAEDITIAVNGFAEIAKFEYDFGNLIAAIQAKDYDAIETELLALKNIVIAKWLEAK